MNSHQYLVEVLRADGTAFVVTHWETAEAALDQFKASLGLAGHPPHQAQFNTDTAAQQIQRGHAYVVMNPEFGTGAVEIRATPPKGRRMSTQ